jgi:type II secretory pathway pseudopilin PulG
MRKFDMGYTILETMIFLAVSSALFVSAMTAVSGQQVKTQFSQSVRDFDTRIRDIVNQVSTGTYEDASMVHCAVNPAGSGVIFSSSGTDQTGKNTDCVFIGKVLQLGITGESTDGQYRLATYTVLGKRLDSVGKVVSTLTAAQPTAISSPALDTTIVDPLLWSAVVVGTAGDFGSSVDQPFGGLAFYNELANFGPSGGNLQSGSQNVGLSIINSAGNGTLAGGISRAQMVSAISDTSQIFPLSLTGKGARICLESAGGFINGNKYAKLTIGGLGKQLSTKIEFDQPVNCQPGL